MVRGWGAIRGCGASSGHRATCGYGTICGYGAIGSRRPWRAHGISPTVLELRLRMPGAGPLGTRPPSSGQNHEGWIGVKSVLEFDDRQLMVER
jgi:hypothetical protein